MYAGDRWIKNQGRQGDYVWLPLEFDGEWSKLELLSGLGSQFERRNVEEV